MMKRLLATALLVIVGCETEKDGEVSCDAGACPDSSIQTEQDAATGDGAIVLPDPAAIGAVDVYSDPYQDQIAMVLDDDDRPHIAYLLMRQGLFYAHAQGTEWVIEMIASGEDVGDAHVPSIAVASSGRVYIAANTLYERDGGTWRQSNVVDDTNWINSAVAVDQDDNVHVVYIAPDAIARYGSIRGGTWASTQIGASSASRNNRVSIAIDSSKLPHVVYSNFDGGEETAIAYGHLVDGTWQVGLAFDTEDQLAGYPFIALDHANVPHIVYSGDFQHRLKYATLSDGVWTQSIVEDETSSGYYPWLAFDSSDTAYVGTSDAIDPLYLYKQTGSTWDRTEIAPAKGTGFDLNFMECAIAIDEGDDVHVAYTTGGYGYGAIMYKVIE